MPKSKLSPGGGNLFQQIKGWTAAAEDKGIKVYKLTIGQPTGPALLSARLECSSAVMSEKESMHEYQDNGSPGVPGFAEEFVNFHQGSPLKQGSSPLHDGLAYLPIPGIKPMLGIIPQACGHVGCYVRKNPDDSRRILENVVFAGTMTAPGYPTPSDRCRQNLIPHYALRTNPENEFQFSLADIEKGTTLLMLNYPHNPTGQAVNSEFWTELCTFCQKEGIRIFNDAAYAKLAYFSDVCTLAEVAQDFAHLSWAEAYSASKVIANGTGWRVGAMVGSPDFIGDIAKIKGDVDSGLFAPAAYGVLKCIQHDQRSITAVRDMYLERNSWLMKTLSDAGMKLAVVPVAGFFSLWLCPKKAFGQEIESAEQFNELMINNTGVAGVHFGQYVRYSVTAPVELEEWREAICSAFDQAKVEY